MQDGTFDTLGHPGETGRLRGDVMARDCPTRQLLDRIGDKWSMLVLQRLGTGEMRFSELKRRIGGVSQKMLTQTLRTLERDGLLTRTVEPTVPVTVRYDLTPLGRTLLDVLQGMIDWAETRMGQVDAAQRVYDARQGMASRPG